VIPNSLLLLFFVLSISLFFWGIYKMLKTQKIIYAWMMLPFLLFIIAMMLL